MENTNTSDMVQRDANPAIKVAKDGTSLDPAKEAGTKEAGETRLTSEALAKVKKREALYEQKARAMQERESQLAAREAKYKKLQDNPSLDGLEEVGISTNSFMQKLLAKVDEKEPEPIDLANKKIEELARKLEEREAREAEQKRNSEDQYIQRVAQDYVTRAWDHVSSNPDKYEFTIANDAKNLILDVVGEYFTRFGEIPTMEEAADHVEQYYVDEFQRYAKAKKARSLIEQNGEGSRNFSQTLSNSLQSHSAPMLGERQFASRRDEISAVARAWEQKQNKG